MANMKEREPNTRPPTTSPTATRTPLREARAFLLRPNLEIICKVFSIIGRKISYPFVKPMEPE